MCDHGLFFVSALREFFLIQRREMFPVEDCPPNPIPVTQTQMGTKSHGSCLVFSQEVQGR